MLLIVLQLQRPRQKPPQKKRQKLQLLQRTAATLKPCLEQCHSIQEGFPLHLPLAAHTAQSAKERHPPMGQEQLAWLLCNACRHTWSLQRHRCRMHLGYRWTFPSPVYTN